MTRQAGVKRAAEKRSAAFPSIEGLNDRLRKAAEITKRCNDWFARSRQPFTKRYREGHLKIAISRVSRESGHYGVVYQVRENRELKLANLSAGDRYRLGLSSDIDEPSMLSLNVKLMESVENVVPSFVRFELFNNNALISREPLYIFEPIFDVGEFGEAFKDRKLCVRSPTYAVSGGECSREDVESRSCAVDDHSNFGIDDKRDRVTLADLDEVASRARIYLYERWIRAEFAPGANPRFKDWKLGYGPIDAGLSF